MKPIRPALLALALSLLSGCGAFTAVSEASAARDAYTLSPATAASAPATGSGHLVVELPSSAGALANDRILIKPVAFQAQYLPDAQWSEPAPALVQTLLVTSFQNLGGFRLVGRTGAGLMPDYTLMTELQEFHAEPAGAEAEPLDIRVSAMMTLIRESDRRIIATRRFAATTRVQTDDTTDVVRGFDSALRQVLGEAVVWTRAQTR
ncbi:ABC-type transport auxiliary lipoprotein family protein [Frigidibacter sp.]|uniref:ABC-type transport auxiliary lipoprotein family protein n=1 Tax=Frigidibacter sp. TaxID=2586418 RepID=UPI0027340DF8|nr:ABC-type transport auxiliary lipoprotein family protein [Frigidibacter sp.]MDP3340562.1 ABC-type transport auxiliary lipoprotein family protein [Frigidibacter sp.]